MRRLQADQTAGRRRNANRAAGVGADRGVRHPARTDAADPPEEPPGERVSIERMHDRTVRGVLVGRAQRELVEVRLADEDRAGRPAVAPTTVASRAATCPSRTREAAVVGVPRRSMMSLSEIGTP